MSLGNVESVGSDEIRTQDLEHVPAEMKKLATTFLSQLDSLRTALHFKPFEVDGRPGRAEFTIDIPIRPLQDEAVRHVPFPQIRDWNSVVVRLSRSGCFGTCPSYSVEIHGNGTVLYTGEGFVTVMGQHRATIAKDVVAQMVDAFRAANFYSLRDEYRWGATDLPTYTVSFSSDGKSKKLLDYAGQKVGMPESVSKLEETIDRLSGVERWTKGNADTVPALMAEHFDFKSDAASEILTNAADRGTADAVRDLVNAGVMVSAKPGPRGWGRAGSALDNAAFHGDVEKLRALLNAGAQDPQIKTTALEHAAVAGKLDAMRLLIQSGANPVDPNVLVGTASSGVPAVVEEILRYKPNVNARDQNGWTVLTACVDAHHYKDVGVDLEGVVRLFLEAGADPNLADNEGNTALILNARNLKIPEMLVAHGANVNAQAKNGFTPLLNAEPADLVRFLLAHGADLYAKDREGETALELARRMGPPEKAKLLEAAMNGNVN
jgi:ankyrin repeat protein